MSIIVSVYCNEGIVLASDSRITLSNTKRESNGTHIHLAIGQSDSNYKTFLAGNIGISFCGDSDIKGVPISGYIEAFIGDYITKDTCVSEVPDLLLKYFNDFDVVPDSNFFVAGYTNLTNEQVVYGVYIKRQNFEQLAADQGTSWMGEADTLNKLLNPVYKKEGNVLGIEKYTELPFYSTEYNFFTLQDSIDFAVYAVKTTIDTMRFQTRPKTVGGPIDVLVIKPREAFWVQRKELHVR
ncbi:hypothetical protein IBT50_14135 [Bacillus sp. S70]|uniref:hypothetical protein n=1 Tax=Bacillus TaxID=1386 RepID=UPI00097886E8|nr:MULTISPECIES: hypothetical protein [Bacillus]MBJ9980922.1 hypothetical protein [Bacillus sp. S29]MBK0102496.1 hypothetical protein [Bacillus sp. S70]MBK0106013.1 hypothetical protein [Bacillus sp. S73]MBK0135500.1 hypothetical protein [Bacillus sp. S72]MBK0151287.1 hypothetical protein [Bacillus sp. S74]